MKQDLPSAGFWRRMVSFFYEVLLLTALLLIAEGLFQGIFQLFSGLPVTRLADFAWLRALNLLWLAGITLAYFGWCWIRSGQTLAMKTWRCRLLMKDGRALNRTAVLIRFTLACVFYAPLLPIWILARKQPEFQPALYMSVVLFVLPLLWALFDRDRQFLHDHLAKTRLVFFPKALPSKYAQQEKSEE